MWIDKLKFALKYDRKPMQKGKVYDCFTFYNELELLEIRLNELKDVVDKFILVESTATFTGKPKPLYFQENKERFKEFLPKIINVAIDGAGGDPWSREKNTRNKMLDYLRDCVDNDVIIISDIDEIPSASAVAFYTPDMGLRCFKQRLYYYYFNCYLFKWFLAKILPYGFLKMTTPSKVRNTAVDFIANGGWHFSFQGGVDSIIEKIQAWSHQEFNIPEIKNREHIEKAMNEPSDLFGRPKIKLKFVPLDVTFPKYVIENKEKFKTWIK